MKQYQTFHPVLYPDFAHLVDGLGEYGEAIAIACYDRRQNRSDYSYTQLSAAARALSHSLINQGLAGKHIAIISENSWQYLLAFLAVTASGGVAVLVDIEQPEAGIADLIQLGQAEAVFASAAFLPPCQRLREQGELSHLFSLSPGQTEGVDDVEQLIAAAEAASIPPRPQLSPDQPAAIVFTSGTTSQAKPVLLSQGNIIHNAYAAMTCVDLLDDIFTSLPFYHSYGLTCSVLMPLLIGARLTINGDLRTMMRDFTLARPRTLITVPLIVEALYNQVWVALEKEGRAGQVRKLLRRRLTLGRLGLTKADAELRQIRETYLGRLELIFSGGAALETQIAQELLAFGVLVLQGYGITECSPLISVNRNQNCRFGTVGQVLPGSELRLQEDEIQVRGPGVMLGYYRDPAATAAAMDGPWFRTGDLGSIDKDGFLSITGRSKNLIVLKNGKKISPEKIEDMLRKLPMVKDVVVYGAASGTAADDVRPAASIYPDPALTAGLSSYQILDQLQAGVDQINAALPAYQQIQMINIRDQEFSKTASHKIKRHLI